MLWQNLSSMGGQMHKKTDVNLFFYNNKTQNGQMPGINEGKRCSKVAVNKDKVNFIQNDANIVNSFSRFLIGYLKKSIKSHWLKR